jgi:hypothetical protein
MENKKRWNIRKGLSLAVILLCMAGHLYLAQHGARVLPKGVEISGEEDILLDGTQIKALEDSERYSFAMEDLLEVESVLTEGDFDGKEFPDRRINVEGWYTDSRYAQTCQLSMVDGTYFSVNPIGEFSQSVVISDELARKLFFRENVSGERLQIDGKSYVICGVYKKDRNLPSRLSEGRFDRVYLPYPAYQDADSEDNQPVYEYADGNISAEQNTGTSGSDASAAADIETAVFHPAVYPVRFFYDRGDGEARFSGKVTGELEEVLGVQLPVMQTVDMREYAQLIWQTFRLALLFAGIIIEFFLLGKIWGLVFARRISHRVPEKREKLWRAGCIAGILLLMAAIGAVIAFPVVIPSSYLPRENIFQISWYLDALAQARQSDNSRTIYSMYQGTGGRTLWLCVGFLAVEVMGCVQAALLGKGSGCDGAEK